MMSQAWFTGLDFPRYVTHHEAVVRHQQRALRLQAEGPLQQRRRVKKRNAHLAAPCGGGAAPFSVPYQIM